MAKEASDIFLFRRIQDNDQSAFRFLFETYFTSIYRFIFLYIKDKTIVEEIALDVFTAFWEKRKTLDIKISIKSYLFQSARNRSLNFLRNNERQVQVEGNISMPQLVENFDSLEVKELEILIEEAISSLPEKCRDIFRMSRSENLTNKEIASKMNITTKGVEAQITKALKHIKEYLNRSYNLW